MAWWKLVIVTLLGIVVGAVVGYLVGYVISDWALRDCSELDCVAVLVWAAISGVVGAIVFGIASPLIARRVATRRSAVSGT